MKPTNVCPPKRTSRRDLPRAFLADERGGEVIEWALVAGLIVIATIAIIGAVGTKVLARWNSVNDAPL
jgi:Flp pilus assembly pilin Flp